MGDTNKNLSNYRSCKDRGLIALIIVFILIGTAPFIYGLSKTPPAHHFDWLATQAGGDILVYYSYINQIRDGAWLIRDLFTSESGTEMLNIAWLIIGLLGRLLKSLPTEILFHLSKYIFTILYIFIIYHFFNIFYKESLMKRWLLFFLLFATGSGGIIAIFYNSLVLRTGTFDTGAEARLPIDLWVTEMYNLTALNQSPHLVLSLISIVSTFYFFLRGYIQKKSILILLGGGSALLLFQFHPYHVPVIYTIVTIFLTLELLIKKISFKTWFFYLFIFIGVSFWSILYHFYALSHSPVLAYRALQNINRLPLNPAYIIAGFGLLLPLGLYGFYQIYSKERSRPAYRFLLIWFAVNLIAIFIPYKFQSRATQTFSIPLILTFWYGTQALRERSTLFQKILKYLGYNLFLAACLFMILFWPSTLYKVGETFLAYKKGANIFYINQQKMAAYKFMRANLPQDAVVLASPINSSAFIPAYAVRKVFIGHADETINFNQKYKNAYDFWKKDQKSQRTFLENNGIDFIFIDEESKKLGNINLDQVAYKTIFKNEVVEILKITRNK